MVELTEVAYRELFRCFTPNRPGEDPDDHEHDDMASTCDYGWVCNQADCGYRTDEAPCPDHAPTEFAGLAAVECTSELRHYFFAYDNDGYGVGCPSCYAEYLQQQLRPLQIAAALREHRWCWLRRPAVKILLATRLWRSTGTSWDHACSGHRSFRWRWSK